MIVVYKEGGEYSDCIVKHFGLDRYDDGAEDAVFFWGWDALMDPELREKYKDIPHRLTFNTSAPCDLLGHDPRYVGANTITNQEYFTEVFTICPYTANWANTVSSTLHTPICFPFPANKFEKFKETTPDQKLHDVIYYGQFHDSAYEKMLTTMTQFDYKFSTISTHGLTREMAKLGTHYALTSEQKWDLLNKCKISVGFNLLFLNRSHLHTLSSFPNIETFEKLKMINKDYVMPQMKTRMVEAAACKTLMLICRDGFSVIENWFEPNKHFIYWDTYQDLHDKIEDITNNYEKYWPIVEAAHEHVQQYSIENFMEKLNERLLEK
tara:strand:- start:863 stop:1831 length:969 start_codon:yes stop_codon:yes gene_type:complete